MAFDSAEIEQAILVIDPAFKSMSTGYTTTTTSVLEWRQPSSAENIKNYVEAHDNFLSFPRIQQTHQMFHGTY